jgi:hypothetical protein
VVCPFNWKTITAQWHGVVNVVILRARADLGFLVIESAKMLSGTIFLCGMGTSGNTQGGRVTPLLHVCTDTEYRAGIAAGKRAECSPCSKKDTALHHNQLMAFFEHPGRCAHTHKSANHAVHQLGTTMF